MTLRWRCGQDLFRTLAVCTICPSLQEYNFQLCTYAVRSPGVEDGKRVSELGDKLSQEESKLNYVEMFS